jgi:hypothetical protein
LKTPTSDAVFRFQSDRARKKTPRTGSEIAAGAFDRSTGLAVRLSGNPSYMYDRSMGDAWTQRRSGRRASRLVLPAFVAISPRREDAAACAGTMESGMSKAGLDNRHHVPQVSAAEANATYIR